MKADLSLTDLRPLEGNPRRLSDTDRERLVASLERFGDLSGIVVNRREGAKSNGSVVGGNQRTLLLGRDQVGQVTITDRLEKPNRVLSPVHAFVVLDAMRAVVDRGTGNGVRGRGYRGPAAGKTGTTNDSKDVWFVGFSSNIAAGCYIGYDTPRSLGRSASGGGTCGPVFSQFMREAIKKYGGGPFETPPDCEFIKIDRFSGARLPNNAGGQNVIAECFRPGEEPVFGITFDGGFAMAGDLPLFEEVAAQTRQVTTSPGGTATVGPRATAGALASGGLY